MQNKDYYKEWASKNQDKVKQLKAEWYKNNRARLLEKSKQYSYKNRDKIHEIRKTYPSYGKLYPSLNYTVDHVKKRARDKINYRIEKKMIFSKPCEVCGVTKTHGHHPDYSKPLEVVWLCPKHHGEIHRKKL